MITINSQPQKFTPVENPVIYQITSNSTGITYFLVEVLSEDNSVIAVQKYYTLPNYTSGTYFDLSSILKNYVDYELVNSNNIIEQLSKMILKYKVKVSEYVFDGTNIVVGSNITTGLNAVWNAEIKRTAFSNFNYRNQVLTISGGTQFLTAKPLVSKIYKDSTEFIYLLNDSTNYNVRMDFYGKNNILIGTQNLSGVTSGVTAANINISPAVLSNYFGDDFNNLYGDSFYTAFDLPFGSYYKADSANYFTVQMVDGSGNPFSEKRTYILSDSKCNVPSFDLIFSNDLGGYDSLRLFHPKETITSTQTSISKYPYKLNSANQFTNLNNGIYNDTTDVINSNSVSTYKAISDVLSDDTSIWLKGVVKAKKVYVRLSNDYLLPVSVSNDSYNVQLKKYSTNNNRFEITFQSDVSGLFE